MESKQLATTKVSGGARVDLHYCPRCGALCVAPPEMDNCPACRRALDWIYGARSAGLRTDRRKDSHAPAQR